MMKIITNEKYNYLINRIASLDSLNKVLQQKIPFDELNERDLIKISKRLIIDIKEINLILEKRSQNLI